MIYGIYSQRTPASTRRKRLVASGPIMRFPIASAGGDSDVLVLQTIGLRDCPVHPRFLSLFLENSVHTT